MLNNGYTFNRVKILFKIRGKSLYCRITVNSIRANSDFSINEKVDPKLWDSKKQKLMGGGTEADAINTRLERIRAAIKQFELDLTHKGKPVTANVLKELFLGRQKMTYTLIDTSEKHLSHMEGLPPGEISQNTVKAYRYRHNNLVGFLLAKKLTKITCEEFRPKVAQDFQTWLRTEKKPPITQLTAAKNLEYVRKVLKFSITQEWTLYNPMQAFTIKKGPHKMAVYLTDEERERLERKTFSAERLQRIKDIFVFLCHTGLSYTDIRTFRASQHVARNSEVYFIDMSRIKTGVDFYVPLTHTAWDILQKYGGEMLPIPSNQKLNAYLKEVQDLCRIETNLTARVARTTFGVVMLNEMGVPLEVVSRMLGHTTVKMTEKHYTKVLKQKIVRDVVMKHPNLYKKTGS